MSDVKAKSKSEKFPPPHQDGAVGYPLDTHQEGTASFGATDTSFSSIFDPKSSRSLRNNASRGVASRRNNKDEPQRAPSRKLINALYPSSMNWSMDFMFHRRRRHSEDRR